MYVPTTKRWSPQHLYALLQNHETVYFKPNRGAKGIGVFRVSKSTHADQITYYYQYQAKTRSFSTFQSLTRFIKSQTKHKSYLIQQGISLLTYQSSPFDLRVMVQHNPQHEWEITGMVGRVAHPKKVVTNGSQGGTPYPVKTLLTSLTSNIQSQELINQINNLSLQVANHLQTVYPEIKEIGLDIAIDKDYKLWIIEFNTLPELHPFAKLEDKRMLKRIISTGKNYGRSYRY